MKNMTNDRANASHEKIKVKEYLEVIVYSQVAIPIGLAIYSIQYSLTQEEPFWYELVVQLLGSLFLLFPYILGSLSVSICIIFPATLLCAKMKILNTYVIVGVVVLVFLVIDYRDLAPRLLGIFLAVGAGVYWYLLWRKKLLT